MDLGRRSAVGVDVLLYVVFLNTRERSVSDFPLPSTAAADREW